MARVIRGRKIRSAVKSMCPTQIVDSHEEKGNKEFFSIKKKKKG